MGKGKGKIIIEFNYTHQDHQITTQQMQDLIVDWGKRIKDELCDVHSKTRMNGMALFAIDIDGVQTVSTYDVTRIEHI